MPAPQGVQAFLEASTAHITREDNELLRAWASMDSSEVGPAAPFRTIGHAYGYFVHVRLDGSNDGCEAPERLEAEADAREQGMSEGFFQLQAYARDNGCWWINLDRDADEIEGLPVYEWAVA